MLTVGLEKGLRNEDTPDRRASLGWYEFTNGFNEPREENSAWLQGKNLEE